MRIDVSRNTVGRQRSQTQATTRQGELGLIPGSVRKLKSSKRLQRSTNVLGTLQQGRTHQVRGGRASHVNELGKASTRAKQVKSHLGVLELLQALKKLRISS